MPHPEFAHVNVSLICDLVEILKCYIIVVALYTVFLATDPKCGLKEQNWIPSTINQKFLKLISVDLLKSVSWYLWNKIYIYKLGK